jgi:hypothetical protein
VGEIADAAHRLDERKAAAMGPLGEGLLTDEEGGALYMLSGLDLDLEEVRDFSAKARQITFACAMNGATITDIAAALWVEGVAMGLLIAEDRDRRGGGS